MYWENSWFYVSLLLLLIVLCYFFCIDTLVCLISHPEEIGVNFYTLLCTGWSLLEFRPILHLLFQAVGLGMYIQSYWIEPLSFGSSPPSFRVSFNNWNKTKQNKTTTLFSYQRESHRNSQIIIINILWEIFCTMVSCPSILSVTPHSRNSCLEYSV